VSHTRFPKEDHQSYWARRDNKVAKGDRVKGTVHRSWDVYVEFLVGPEGENHLRPNLRWEDNIRVHVKEVGSEDVDWVQLTLDRRQ